MNVAFFLTPKNEIVYLQKDMTLRQALEKMEHHRYKSLPIIDEEGGYYGVVTEGDVLWEMKRNPNLTFQDTENIPLSRIPRYWQYKPVRISASMDSLIELAGMQSFVPVVDDGDIFIGIIKRSDIINYCYGALDKAMKKNQSRSHAWSHKVEVSLDMQ